MEKNKNKINHIHSVPFTLYNEMKVEEVLFQLQTSLSSAIVSLRDDNKVIIFKKKQDFPIAYKYEGCSKNLYKFKSLTDNRVYTIFGSEAASIFHPSLFNSSTIFATIDHDGVISVATCSLKEKAEISKVTFEI